MTGPTENFEPEKHTEIGLCTYMDGNIIQRFSCLDGDDNFCCYGITENEKTNFSASARCCSLTDFAKEHQILTTTFAIFMVIIAILVILLVALLILKFVFKGHISVSRFGNESHKSNFLSMRAFDQKLS
jgi:hypothetical protein